MSPQTERAALVGVVRPSSRSDPDHSLDELAGLADAAGASVVLRMLQERPKPDPATFIGTGKVSSLAAACDEADVDVVIFDNELSPAQLRQLEERLERKVIDRTQLILDIFARRARTREGHDVVIKVVKPGRKAAGRIGPAQVSASETCRIGDRSFPPRRWHRHPRTRRNQTRVGPAANPCQDSGDSA